MAYDDDHEEKAVVIDNGSFLIKTCFAGSDMPRSTFRTIIGRVKSNIAKSPLSSKKEHYVGDEALCKKAVLDIRYPIKRGFIENWDDIEAIWHHTYYNELRIEPEEHNAIYTEPPLNPDANREKTTEIAFETFNHPAFYLMNLCCAALYSYGRTTGVVVDSGYEMTRFVPIYEGYAMPHAVKTCDIGGYHINKLLLKKLKEKENYVKVFGASSNISFAEYQTIESIKTCPSVCFVPLDFDKAQQSSDLEMKYELPDGQVITLNEERIECGDILFNPNILGQYNLDKDGAVLEDGIHITLRDAVQKCDSDIRKEMYENITVVGGNTMFKGFVEKLQQEMVELVDNDDVETKVIGVEERKYSVMIGCSIVADLATAWDEMAVTKEEYDESGPRIVHRKCV